MNTLGIFAKHPIPGRVKTRLAESIGEIAATEFAQALLDDAVNACRSLAHRRVIGFSPPDACEFFRQYETMGYDIWRQPDGGLGQRMAAFFRTFLVDDQASAVLIGTDSPTMPRRLIADAFELLKTHDCVLGPATDGGYYLIGLRRTDSALFDNMTFSSSDVLDQTCLRLRALGFSLALLQPWYDVDTADNLGCLAGHLHAMRTAGINPECPATEAVTIRVCNR